MASLTIVVMTAKAKARIRVKTPSRSSSSSSSRNNKVGAAVHSSDVPSFFLICLQAREKRWSCDDGSSRLLGKVDHPRCRDSALQIGFDGRVWPDQDRTRKPAQLSTNW